MKTFFPMICVGCLFLHLVSAAEGQAKLRNIQDAPLQPGSPITVVGREVGDKTFDGGNGVLVGRDWLRGLTLRVKNVSDKNIVYFNIDFIVSKQARMPGSIGLSVFFGNRTAPARTSPGDMVLRPGEIVKVRLSDDEFTYWDKVLKNYGADDIDRISMDIRTVHFEDGTGWQLGIPLRQEPETPKTWTPTLLSESRRKAHPWDPVAIMLPTASLRSFGQFMSFSIPANGRNFYASDSQPRPLPGPTCGYFRGNDDWNNACGGCTDPDDYIGCESQSPDVIYASPPGTLGWIDTTFSDRCRGAPNFPGGPPTCNSCPLFTRPRFNQDPQCGQPGSCAQGSTWGCIYPLVSIGGVCQRTITYQNACIQRGGQYQSLSCDCSVPCPPQHCPEGTCWDDYYCACTGDDSPLVIDVDGNGINLTGQLSGVYFDLNADGRAEKISWTGTGSDDAWLALDRDGNGIIDNGRELFGNMTAPRPENYENGFLELAAWDQTEYGGNADGQISDRDSVYSDLKLWQDKNHNGISEPGELQSFPDLGLRSIALDYKKASARDRNGNVFKFRSKVIDIKGFQLGRWARDVLLKSSQGSSARPTYTSKKTRLSRRKRG